MHIRSDRTNGTVCVVLTSKEAVRLASQLVKEAIASGGAVENERPVPPEPDVEKREP